jgi:hypothetical protein
MTPKYTEILKLKTMLEDAKIPFLFKDDMYNGYKKPSYQIEIIKNGIRLCDAVQNYGSYGEEKDLIEIMGGLTYEENKKDSVLGYLTADDVFKRFKYCYENNTSIYLGGQVLDWSDEK